MAFVLLCAVIVSAPMAASASVPARSLYVQCVDFAKAATGLPIRGDAWMWWENAKGRFERGPVPTAGSVLVFKRTGSMRYGHVAVVRRVLGPREVLADHANWGGSRGRVSRAVSVVDVSSSNDWTTVRVWYGPVAEHGSPYKTYGFIYPSGRGPWASGALKEAQTADVERELDSIAAQGTPERARARPRSGRAG